MKARSGITLALLVSLVCALTVSLATAQPPMKFDRSPYTIQYKKFVLENGLTLLVHEDHSVPIVGVNMWYHVGSRNEKRGKTGFAHLFEHFFFNGSENYPHGFREAMDDLGANNRNGTTNTDRTNFFEDVPVSALERTLYLEADRMGFLANYISKPMLDRERGVVQNEKRQGENQPYGRVFQNISEKLYPYSHPYSWSTIGTMEDLNAASLEDIKEWYRTYYGPNNAVISLAGDITPERALALVKKYFDGIPPGPPLPRTERWIPTLDRNLRDEMQDRVPQARIYRVYHAPSWKEQDTQRLSLVADTLAGSKSSRLDRRLVYEKELATDVTAALFDSELGSLFLLIATVKPGVNPAVVEAEMDSVVTELLDKGVTTDELSRAQNRNVANFLRGMERLGGFGGRSDILAESQTYGGSPDFYLHRLEWMATATPADVKAAANQWLRANHYTLLVKPFEKLLAGKTQIDRKILPALGEAPDIKFPEVQRAKLKNGLNVVLLERHSAPIVNVALAVDAGTASDAVEKAGLATLALDLMDEGTKTRNAFQIADELDALGSRLSTGSSIDLSFVRLQATAQNLQKSLSLMADVVLNPSFPASQFDILKQRRLAQIGQEKANPNAVFQRILLPKIYGANHAYGKTASGTEQSIKGLSRDDLMKWHADWFKPGSATVVVTGDTTLPKILPLLEEAFANWKVGTAPAKNLGNVARTPGRKIFLLDKPEAPQSVIVAAHVSEKGGHPEDLAAAPLLQNFGGMATSRLNRNLRLDKHWSYGASGVMLNARGQRVFLVIAPVQTDKTKESIVEVLKELRDVSGARPVTGEEFQSIMRNMTSRLPARFETLGALENAALEMINLNLPNDYWAQYGAKMRRLTEADLAAAAKTFVHPDEVIWIVVGDLSKIEKGIRELNLGEIMRIDAEGMPLQ